MDPTTTVAAHIGRVGAVAVALGIGAALTTGTGVAWAEPPGSDSTAHDSSPGSSAKSEETKQESPSKDTAPPKAGPRKERRGTVSSSGGALTSSTFAGRAADRLKRAAKAVEDAVATAKSDNPGRLTPRSNRNRVSAAPKTKPAPAVTVPDLTAPARTGTGAVGTARHQVTPRATVTPKVAVTVPKPASTPDIAKPEPLARLAVTPSRVETPAPPRVTTLVSGLLAAVGFSPLAANTPVAPTPPPALWTLLAYARREFGPAISTAAVVDPLPSHLNSVPVGWVTGVTNPSGSWPQTNNTSGFNIDGTDLGIMWDGGTWNGQRFVHTAFGDTFSGPDMTGDWRSNALLISVDRILDDGLALVQTGPAYQFIPATPAGVLGLDGSEVTVIPTSGVQIDGTQYVNYMSVKSWDTPGRWTTNYSAISVYDPTTDKWVLAPSTIRAAGWFRSTTPYVPGSQNFQQAAYVLEPADQVGEDGIRYLYAFGTPSGRAGSAFLSRVPEESVTDLSTYQYWAGDKWVSNAAQATPIIGDSTRSAGLFGFVVDWANDPNVAGGYLGGLFGAKTGGNVSEMSVQYNEYLDKYVVLYADGNNDVQMRVADEPEGPWSTPVTVATSADYPGLYAPMIHPWSGTGMLTDTHGTADTSDDTSDLSDLYWNMSIWGDYNVVLMQTDLSPLQTIQV